jgi:cell division protein FtsI/penicillin-binding protein 2
VRRAAAVLAALAVAVTGCSLFGDDPKPDDAAVAFLDAWARGDVAAAAAATDNAAGAQAVLQQVKEALGEATAELAVGEVETDGDRATAAYRATWSIPGVAEPWRYDGRLALTRGDDAWQVHWEPADVHPRLGESQGLAVERALPERASLTDAAGRPLFRETDVVIVGIQPNQVTNLARLARTLADELDISAADIVADVRKAKPTAFVPVITLRRPDYEKVKPRIHALPGTFFREDTRLLGPTARFAQPLLGRVGEATKEVLDEAGPAYRTGDELGLSGLQRALNDELTGTAGATVRIVDAQEQPVATVGEIAGKPGTAVRTTLDTEIQTAADAAVATRSTPTALVAVRPSTGALVAVANNEAVPYEIGLAGRYPPGSTFKVVTTTALLDGGAVRSSSTVDCPATTTVFGKVFQNEDRFALGRVPLKAAFARSCNTTFTALSERLAPPALGEAAAGYGVGTKWRLPVDSFGGSVPAPKDDTEKAADAIGQGRVEVSPLALALVVAAVQRGSAVVPSLLAGTPAETDGEGPSGPPEAVLPALRDMMRAVVTDGTGRALADLPGEPVFGKTGTAEYGTETPPRAHAWFIGYRGDLAFAVFVQDGEHGRTAAVPVARTFLAALS